MYYVELKYYQELFISRTGNSTSNNNNTSWLFSSLSVLCVHVDASNSGKLYTPLPIRIAKFDSHK